MSFILTELSDLLGSPFELYEFTNGPSTWRYTSGRKLRTLTGPARDFPPRAIRRTNIELSSEFARSSITLTVPRDLPFALQFVAAPPEGLTQLVIYRGHDRDAAGEIATYWTGRVIGVAFGSDSTATIKCDTAYTGMQSVGRRATYSIQCRRSLYQLGCNVDRELFKVSGVITTIAGLQHQSAAFATKPDGWLSGGTLEMTVGGQLLRRLIVSHVGNTIRTMGPVYGAVVGTAFNAFAGCDRVMATCNTKFNNVINFGGFPWKPLSNPFTGDSLF